MVSDPKIRPLKDEEAAELVNLWTHCGLTRPQNDPHQDIAFARASDNAEVLVCRRGGKLAGSVMVGHDGHRGTIYYLAVDPDHRDIGIGRAMVEAAEEWLKKRGVWKLNLLVRSENQEVIGFYRAIGYRIEENIQMARRLDGKG